MNQGEMRRRSFIKIPKNFAANMLKHSLLGICKDEKISGAVLHRVSALELNF